LSMGSNAAMCARRIAVAERRAFVISMRKAGATYEQIAEMAIQQFGREALPKAWNWSFAATDVHRTLDKLRRGMQDDLREYMWFQIQRYESLIRAHWPQAMKGHEGHTDRVLKAMQGMNKLMGLDAPQKLDVRVEQIDTRIEQLMAVIEGQPVAQLAAGREEEAPGKAGAEGFGSDDAIVEGSFRAA